MKQFSKKPRSLWLLVAVAFMTVFTAIGCTDAQSDCTRNPELDCFTCPAGTVGQLADFLQKPCEDTCNDPLTRGEVVKILMAEVEQTGLLMGYTPPTTASYMDVPLDAAASESVEQAVWLRLQDAGNSFMPNWEADSCWVDDLINGIRLSPRVYGVVLSVQPDMSLSPNADPTLVARYQVFGTTDLPLHSLRVINDPKGVFEKPTPTDALEGVVVRCENPAGIFMDMNYFILPGWNGFGVVNLADGCKDEGEGLVFHLLVDPAPEGAEQQATIGLSADFPVRGWPLKQGGYKLPTITVQ